MQGIFISYRREDSAGYAGRLYDRLAAHFGDEHVFMDVEGIEPGADFIEAIERAVSSCDALIVIIGNEWLATDSAGHRRLDDPADFVRLETAVALARGIRVVPVLVDGAAMPRADQLPVELAPLARRQAVELSHKQWDASSVELIRTLEKILGKNKVRIAKPASAEPQLPPEPSVAKPRSDRRYWWLGAVLLAAGAGSILLYLTEPWRQDSEHAPRPAHLAVAPKLVEFAEQPQRIAGPASAITLTNDGGAALHVSSVNIEGSAAADFRLSENQCSGRELAPAASCSVKVTFSAKAAGLRAATLAIVHDAGNAAETISVQGRGAEPVVAEIKPPVERPLTPPAGRPAPVQEQKPEIATAAPKILFFESRFADGKVWLCYGVENAASATITPQPGAVKPLAKPKECVSVAADVGQTYTLSARSATGAVVSRALAVEARASPPPSQLEAVPNLVGKSRREAIAVLKRAGFEVRVVENEPDSNASEAVDSVVSQLPKGGEPLKAGGRVTLHIAAAPASAAALSTAFPRVGDTWVYRVRSIWKNVDERTFVHQVTAVSGREVRETMSEVASGDNASESKSFGPDPHFVEWRGKGYSFVEFNPFLQVFGGLQPDTAWKSLFVPVEDPFYTNRYSGSVIGWESVSVPAGSFKALRVVLNSSRPAKAGTAIPEPQRVQYLIWYASDAKRTIKHVRTVWATNGAKLDQVTYELVKYRVQ